MLKSTSPAVSSEEERGLLSRTAADNRAYSKGGVTENDNNVLREWGLQGGWCVAI